MSVTSLPIDHTPQGGDRSASRQSLEFASNLGDGFIAQGAG
jgi:hypothetical protein